MQRDKLLAVLADILDPNGIRDFAPNGLQVEGTTEIKTIVTGVTASLALIEKAIELKADALLVHHGYFWKGEAYPITGMKRKRIAALLANNINLLAYHLPLDVHPELGNNAQLAKLLDIEVTGGLDANNPKSVAVKGHFRTPVTADELAQRISKVLNREPLVCDVRKEKIHTVAWCTGGGQSFIDEAALQGIDAFITGEASEQTIHSSREQSIDFFAAGHHATERYGVKALGEHLSETYSELDVTFIDIDNPV